MYAWGELPAEHTRLAFERLVERAVLRDAGDGRYYLDEPSWEALRGIRRRMMLVVLLLAAFVLLALVMSGALTFSTPRASQ